MNQPTDGRILAALFDFDGVIMDTETQYTRFWNRIGEEYLKRKDYGPTIKGQTLTQIFNRDFAQIPGKQMEIEAMLNEFESNMPYVYVPGVQRFIAELRAAGIRTAVVTSSNEQKMSNVYRTYPDFTSQFDEVLTSERFARSKPAPDCFLLGMKQLGSLAENTFIFEDSFHGLEAARASGGIVIGVATTNPRSAITGKADYVIDDFRDLTLVHLHELFPRVFRG